MKNYIIYSITIYMLLFMLILLKKPSILYDNNNNLKSFNYLEDKIKNGYNNYNELISLPLITICISLISHIISLNL